MDLDIELEERVGLLSMGTGDEASEEVVVHVLNDAPDGVLGEGAVDPVYEAKARVLNKAIQDIGMGRYQWQVSCCVFVQCVRGVWGGSIRLHGKLHWP